MVVQGSFLGGRAQLMESIHQAMGPGEPTVEALLACSNSSAAAATVAVSTSIGAAVEEADEEHLTTDAIRGLQALLMVRYVENRVCQELGASGVGPFLNALAAGADAGTPPAAPPRKGTPPLAARGSATYFLATTLRCALLSQFGVDGTCALLRAMTRHGRLHPGPPEVGGADEVVNSEAKQVTPPDQVARMLGATAMESRVG